MGSRTMAHTGALLRTGQTPADLLAAIAASPVTVPDQWQVQIQAKVQTKADVLLRTRRPDRRARSERPTSSRSPTSARPSSGCSRPNPTPGSASCRRGRRRSRISRDLIPAPAPPTVRVARRPPRRLGPASDRDDRPPSRPAARRASSTDHEGLDRLAVLHGVDARDVAEGRPCGSPRVGMVVANHPAPPGHVLERIAKVRVLEVEECADVAVAIDDDVDGGKVAMDEDRLGPSLAQERISAISRASPAGELRGGRSTARSLPAGWLRIGRSRSAAAAASPWTAASVRARAPVSSQAAPTAPSTWLVISHGVPSISMIRGSGTGIPVPAATVMFAATRRASAPVPGRTVARPGRGRRQGAIATWHSRRPTAVARPRRRTCRGARRSR